MLQYWGDGNAFYSGARTDLVAFMFDLHVLLFQLTDKIMLTQMARCPTCLPQWLGVQVCFKPHPGRGHVQTGYIPAVMEHRWFHQSLVWTNTSS